jgi:hypothetical protein
MELNGAKILYTIHTNIPVLGDFKITQTLVSTWIVMALLSALAFWLGRDLKLENVSKRQAAAEFIVERLDQFVHDNMGWHFDKFIPLVGAIFALSIGCNLISVVGLWSPTADLNTEAAWAIVVFIIIMYYKIKTNGILAYLKGLLDPIFLMAPINVLSEVSTPVSMAFRHFGKPIKFAGVGEKLSGLEAFHPERMASRILGMGDVVTLVERAQEQFDEEEARKLSKKIAKNQFDFNDFLTQIHQIKKMGNLKELASMIPGVGKAIKDIDIDDNAFKSIEAIIYSMTPEERTHPEILNGTRRTRIAKGSGTSIQEVNRLLKQFDQTRKMMKMVTGSKMAGMMQKMKKK